MNLLARIANPRQRGGGTKGRTPKDYTLSSKLWKSNIFPLRSRSRQTKHQPCKLQKLAETCSHITSNSCDRKDFTY